MLFFCHRLRVLKFEQASWSPVYVGTNFVDSSLAFCLPWHRSLTCQTHCERKNVSVNVKKPGLRARVDLNSG